VKRLLLTILSLLFPGAILAGPFIAECPDTARLDPPRFEVAAESAYLMCIINNPHAYEVAAEFLTGRIRWGVNDSDNWTRGYQQFYVTAEGQAIVRGIENHYFGLNFGFRYNFMPRGSRWSPYISGGLGLGWIDSNAAIGGSQGQDFTFNILSAAGISYRLSDQWKVDAGILWEHFSNAGQTDPNPSLNLLGPQLAVSYTF
jgi:opacity protein-like surface antigen